MTFNWILLSDRRKLVRHSLLVITASLFGSILSFFFFDQRLSAYFNDDRLLDFRKLARTLTDIGLSENFFIMALGLFMISHFVSRWSQSRPQDPVKNLWVWLKRWSLGFFYSLIMSGVLLHILKFSIGRQRPHRSDTFDADVFVPFQFDHYFQSLPSGHSQTLFCVGTMLHILWPRAGTLIYLPIFTLAFTRVIVHQHFLSDVFIGAAIGHLGTLWTLWFLQKRFPRSFSLSK